MSSRKSNVIIIFSVMLIAMNLIALTHVIATNYNLSDGDNNPTTLGEASSQAISPLDPYLSVESTEVPSLKNWDLNVNVSRIIELHDYGYLTINDNFTLINNDNLTLPIFRFAIPNTLAVNLVEISAGSMWEDSGVALNKTTVEVEYKDGNFTYYIMALNPVVNNESSYTIQVHQTYLRPYNIFLFVSEGYPYNGISMNVTRMPFLTIPINTAKTTFIDSDDGEIISDLIYPNELATIGEGSAIFNPVYNIAAYNFSNAYDVNADDAENKIQIGAYLTSHSPTEATNYARTVSIDNWYYVKIHEEITFENFGIIPDDPRWDLTDFRVYGTFSLQRLFIGIDNAENVKVYDEFGQLPPPAGSDLVQTNQINIYLRYPVYGGGSATVSIDYTLSIEAMLQFEKNEFIYDFLGIPEIPFHVKNYDLTVLLPQGSNVQYVLFGERTTDYEQYKTPIFLRIGRRETISLNKVNLTSFDNLNLKIGYYMSDLAYFIQPLTYSLIIFMACLLYVGVRTLRKDVIEKVVISTDDKDEVPVDLIQDFVEKYEEKTALQTRITELDENRRKKKIKAKEYDQQRKILEAKIRDTIKALDTTKRALKEQGRKYRDSIQKIEVSEEKRISVDRSINDLRIRYIREKAISKDAYVRILRDYQNQIEKFERDIDKEIINLRLLIEHESN